MNLFLVHIYMYRDMYKCICVPGKDSQAELTRVYVARIYVLSVCSVALTVTSAATAGLKCSTHSPQLLKLAKNALSSPLGYYCWLKMLYPPPSATKAG